MITKTLTTLVICTAAGIALMLLMLVGAPSTKRSPALEVTIDPEHGVLCWTSTHHSGMSCLPEWMLIPGQYDSIPNISSANIGQLNGQKDSISP